MLNYAKQITLTACMFAAASLGCSMALSASFTPNKYAKVLVFSEGEDATSNFDYVYRFDNAGNIVSIIHIWNGGCCQMPVIEEFKRVEDLFKHVRSYTLDDKPVDFPKAVLCDNSIGRIDIEPTHYGLAGLKAKDIESHHLKEATVFGGCE